MRRVYCAAFCVLLMVLVGSVCFGTPRLLDSVWGQPITIRELIHELRREAPETAQRWELRFLQIIARDNLPAERFWSTIVKWGPNVISAERNGSGYTVSFEGFTLRLSSEITAHYAGGTWEVEHRSSTTELDGRQVERLEVCSDLFRYYPIIGWQCVNWECDYGSNTWRLVAEGSYEGTGQFYAKGLHYMKEREAWDMYITQTSELGVP